MNTIVEVLASHLLKVAEEEFIKSEPEIQAKLIHMLKQTSLSIESWLKSKLEKTVPSP